MTQESVHGYKSHINVTTMQCFIFEENFCEGGKQRIRANTTFQSLSNWTTMEKTVGQISAFSKEDSVHYYTPGGYYSLTYQQPGVSFTTGRLKGSHYINIIYFLLL